MTPRALGGVTALLVLALDQASKAWLLYGLRLHDFERIAVTPFLDIELLWNTGVSFSLFPQGTAAGRWILLGLTVAATLLLAGWLWRVASRLAAAGLGAIVGGAIGNGYDRFVHGAVVDFVDLHVAGYNWYVFNVADAAITVGVVALLFDGLLAGRRVPPPVKERA
ncbi:MAG: signal peptidase II [Roseiarcus sp.]|jgi:signal peptidase II